MICPHCKNEPHFSGPHPEGMLKKYHPLAGEGYTPETGWTHPEAERLSKEERAAVRRRILPVSARDVYRAMMEWRGTANASNGAPKHAPEAKA